MEGDFANHHGIAGDYDPNNTSIHLPVISVPPFNNWNMNEASPCYNKEIERTGGSYMIDSSQFKSAQNFQMDHHYPYEGQESTLLPCKLDSGFSCPQAYTGWPYQYTMHDTQTITDDVMNAAFDLNSFEEPHNDGKRETSFSSSGRPQMVNPSGTAMSHNTGQPLLNMNIGMTMFNPNQGRAESSLTPGKLDERFMTVGSEFNSESKSNTITPRINVTGNSERMFLPPINAYHSQLGSRSFLSPGLGMNGAFTGFQNDNEVISDLSHTGNQDVLFDSRPSLCLGSSYAFQRPATGDENHYLRQGFERCMSLPSLPYVGSQPVPCSSGQSRVNGQLVPYSVGMLTAQCPSELLPENSGKLSSQSFASPPLVAATRSTKGQASSSYHSQTQVVGSIQQSNSPFGQQSNFDLGIQTGKGNMIAQVSRPSTIASVKRAASQPLPLTVQDQRRKTLPAHSFIHPSIPTWTRVAPPVPNTPGAIPSLVHAAQALTPQATHSFAAASAPNMPQTIPPFAHAAQSFTAQATHSFAAPSITSASNAITPLVHAGRTLTPQATHSFAAPSVPNTPRAIPPLVHAAQSLTSQATHSFAAASVPNTPQATPPFLHAAQSLTPQATHSLGPQMFPANWSKSALSAPNTSQSQTIPPVMHIASSLSSHDKRISSLHPLSHAPPLPDQQLIAQALAHQRLRDVHSIAHIKYKDQTPEPIGHKCFLCKRDLSYSPEGPISQPLIPPAAAVLSCGHTFHEYCLEQITPGDHAKDPPCIPCALSE